MVETLLKPRSACPIARSLDLLGDRWTLLLARDLLVGKRRFGEFLESRERITTSVLADRLARLEAAGVVRKVAYQTRPERFEYELAEAGRALLPLLQEFCRWGNEHIAGTMAPPGDFMSRTE